MNCEWETIKDDVLSACRQGHVERLRDILKDHDVDLSRIGRVNVPMNVVFFESGHNVSFEMRIQAARVLIEHNACKESYVIPLAVAVSHGDVEFVRWLVEEKGADVNGNDGVALINAVCEKRAEMVQTLLQSLGANPNVRSGKPLAYALMLGDPLIADMLYSAGAELGAPDVVLKHSKPDNRENMDETIQQLPSEQMRVELVHLLAVDEEDVTLVIE
jgi:hypothetical protein